MKWLWFLQIYIIRNNEIFMLSPIAINEIIKPFYQKSHDPGFPLHEPSEVKPRR